MTLTIDLSPEAEQQLRATAAANGQDVQEYVGGLIARETGPGDSPHHSTRRQQAALKGYGVLKGDGRTVDAFLQARRQEE